MTPKKIIQLLLTNLSIIFANVAVFSKAFLGLSLFAGTALSMTVAWFTIVASLFSFGYFNQRLLTQRSTYALMLQNVTSLDDCVSIFEEAMQNGDVFDKNIMKNFVWIQL